MIYLVFTLCQEVCQMLWKHIITSNHHHNFREGSLANENGEIQKSDKAFQVVANLLSIFRYVVLFLIT